jgi:hypothetical protein
VCVLQLFINWYQMITPEEEHDRDRVIQLVHRVEVGNL